ncbi:translation elongation factor Ts [Thiovibrio frasassiensis]|uniref:Elongation factor Ts n=1 Tax=Thiovibrio frasassiensis TaxID=2984131 RepID=A0A9X4RN45_9BACT|nr:translation elongation factor Ts [Thiovibrio frasassiensis]MDG4476873.1 translation elongation factor Ts [Thiovibrio frasassiensis]
MNITSQMVKELRDKTNAGMMDCKKALTETGGDMEKAVDLLRQKGLAVAQKRAGRATSEGLVETFIQDSGKLGVMVEVNCETDFVAKSDAFIEFAKNVATQVAETATASPAELLEQKFVKNPALTIQDMLNELVAKLGENIGIKRFAKFNEGVLETYIHAGGKLGVMVELACDNDAAAKNADFIEFAKNICMHIAAANPVSISREEVPADLAERERNIFIQQAIDSGKPANIAEKMVGGKMDRFFAESCLLEQKFVKNPDISIQDLLKEVAAKLGANISIKRFARFQVGA